MFGVLRYLSMAAASPFMSMLADHHDRRRVMVIADLVRFALVAVGGGRDRRRWPDAWPSTRLGLITSVVATAFRPAQMALLPSLATHPGELTAANVAASTIESVGFFAGPAIAGALLAFTDLAVVFGFNAAHVPLVRRARRDPAVPGRDRCGGSRSRSSMPRTAAARRRDDRPHSILHGAGAGFREILAQPRPHPAGGPLLRADAWSPAPRSCSAWRSRSTCSTCSEASVGLSTPCWASAGWSAGSSPSCLATRGRLAVDFGFGVLLWSAPLLLVVAWPALGPVLVMMALLGLGNSLVDINAFTIMQRLVPDEVMGRVFGAVESALIAGMALGSLAMPLLINTVGLRTGLFVHRCERRDARHPGHRPAAPDRHDRPGAGGSRADPDRRAVRTAARAIDRAPGQERDGGRGRRPARPCSTKGDAGDRFYVIESGRAEIVLDEGVSTLEETRRQLW